MVFEMTDTLNSRKTGEPQRMADGTDPTTWTVEERSFFLAGFNDAMDHRAQPIVSDVEMIRWIYATARSVDKSGLSIAQYNDITRRVLDRFSNLFGGAA